MELRMKVSQAVHVLNHDTQSCNRVAANQWLVQFQQTGAAWEVATAILTSDRVQIPLSSFVPDLEVEFFAAQILKRKVSSLTLILIPILFRIAETSFPLILCQPFVLLKLNSFDTGFSFAARKNLTFINFSFEKVQKFKI